MELKDITKKLGKSKKTLIGFMGTGLVLATIVYFLPHNYSVEGSFFVKRTAEESSSQVFTYEGYYSQQTALAYTNSVIALLQSTDLMKETLTNLSIPITENNLRKYEQNVNVKKAGPQVITLTVKNSDVQKAKAVWNEMAKVLSTTATEVNTKGDPNLSISQVLTQPVVKEPYKPIWLYVVAGLGFGVLAGISFITLKEYFK